MKGFITAFFVASTLTATSAFALYSPQEAVRDALSEKLVFVGQFMPTYSESQAYPNCIFKNSKVYLMTHYCVDGNVPAGSMRIHSADPKKGYATIYAEAPTANDISEVTRSEYYDVLWTISSRMPQKPFDFGMTAKEYQNFDEAEVKTFSHGCVTGVSFKTLPNSTNCRDLESGNWPSLSFQFWNAPPSDFYKLLKRIKAEVRAN